MPAYFDTGFSVRKPAWHGLGLVPDTYPESVEQAREWAGLTWEPKLVEAFIKVATPTGVGPNGELYEEATYLPMPSRIVVRDDTNGFLGAVSPEYQPIGNGTMFDFLSALVGQGCQFETAGSVKDGATVWALAYLPEPYTLPGDDSESLPFVAVTNAHDGTGSFRAMATQVRIVCWNTVQAAHADSGKRGTYYEFRHQGNVMDRVEQAKAAIKGVRHDTEQWIALAAELLGMTVSSIQLDHFISEFIPMPEADTISPRVRANIDRARDTFRQVYLSAVTNQAHVGTALGLVNASVEYLDHLRGYRNQDTYLGRQILRPEPLKAKAVSIARAVCG